MLNISELYVIDSKNKWKRYPWKGKMIRYNKGKKKKDARSNIGLTPLPFRIATKHDWGLIACQTTRSTKLKPSRWTIGRIIERSPRIGEARLTRAHSTRQRQGSIISEIDATKRQRNGVVTSWSEGEAILPFLSGGGAGWIRLSSSIPHSLSLSLSPSPSSVSRLRPSASLHLSRFYDALSRGRRSGMR